MHNVDHLNPHNHLNAPLLFWNLELRRRGAKNDDVLLPMTLPQLFATMMQQRWHG